MSTPDFDMIQACPELRDIEMIPTNAYELRDFDMIPRHVYELPDFDMTPRQLPRSYRIST